MSDFTSISSAYCYNNQLSLIPQVESRKDSVYTDLTTTSRGREVISNRPLAQEIKRNEETQNANKAWQSIMKKKKKKETVTRMKEYDDRSTRNND